MHPSAASDQEQNRKVRAELNLEQWSIWLPSKSKNPPKPRLLRKEFIDENGNKDIAELELTASRKGTLTTEDQKTYYTLIEIWESQNKSEGDIYFSLNGILKRQGKKWGTRNITTLTNSLSRLVATTFLWKRAFFDSTTKKTHKNLESFRILDKLKIKSIEDGGTTNKAEGYFRFSDDLIQNFKLNHTKPVLLDIVFGFQSDIAQILYTQLDRILSKDIKTYERKTKELFEDLGLEGKEYVYQSARKRIIEKAILELRNIPLSNGFQISSVTLQKTKDGTDYKLVVKRGRKMLQNNPQATISAKGEAIPPLKAKRGLESHTEATTTCPATRRTQTKAELDGDKLLAYFNLVFFGLENSTTARSNHRDLATSIVAQHGDKVARHIVDFAKHEAEKTNFPIATFGAIANYVDRAVVDYTRAQASEKKRLEDEREEAKKRDEERAFEERQERGKQLYLALPEDEREALTKKHEQILLTLDRWKNADFSQSWQQSIFDVVVRDAVREELLKAQK